jgi:uncharacterized protein
VERVFLDANILFSAAYREDSGLAKLWRLKNVELVTSAYALAEARGNLDTDEQRQRLDRLAGHVRIEAESSGGPDLPRGLKLPDKDQPIMRAAIRVGATYLLTGDLRHFGAYFGKTIGGLTILPPADYLERTKGI